MQRASTCGHCTRARGLMRGKNGAESLPAACHPPERLGSQILCTSMWWLTHQQYYSEYLSSTLVVLSSDRVPPSTSEICLSTPPLTNPGQHMVLANSPHLRPQRVLHSPHACFTREQRFSRSAEPQTPAVGVAARSVAQWSGWVNPEPPLAVTTSRT